MQCLQNLSTKGMKTIFLLYEHSTPFCHSLKTQLRSISQLGPVRLAYDVYNEVGTDAKKPPVIIMHDIFGAKQNWVKMAKRLNQNSKRKIYVTDARNHGDSPHNTKHDPESMSEDVHRMVREHDLTRVAVIGHSMGGMAMIYFTMKYPKLVEKAIIVDISPASYPKEFNDMRRILKVLQDIKIPKSESLQAGRAIAERIVKKAVRDESLIDFVILNLKKEQNGEFTWRLNIRFLLGNFYRMVDAAGLSYPPYVGPVLFIGALQARFISENELPEIKKFFPNAKLKWIDSGHLIHREAPKEFMKMSVTFLNKEQPLLADVPGIR